MARLSTTFKSLKPHSYPAPNSAKVPPLSSSSKPSSPISTSWKKNSWIVYLILSTNTPIKTYVGVTNNFSRRLKQHNGDLKGGAKASRAGRPWICACIIEGFKNKSKACQFESKWKCFSRKLPRKRSTVHGEETDNSSLLLLKHRYAALNQVKDCIDGSCLKFDWHIDPTQPIHCESNSSERDGVCLCLAYQRCRLSQND